MMPPQKDWKKITALLLFVMLLGGYYEQASIQTRTMILPMVILVAVAFVIARWKQWEYQVSSFRIVAGAVMAQSISVVDAEGRERMTLAAAGDNATLHLLDAELKTCVTVAAGRSRPEMRLTGENGRVTVDFDVEGPPRVKVEDEDGKVIWSLPPE